MARHILRTLNWDIDEAPDVRRAVVEHARPVAGRKVVPQQLVVYTIKVPEHAPTVERRRA
jgi:hypothetical protein